MLWNKFFKIRVIEKYDAWMVEGVYLFLVVGNMCVLLRREIV